MVLKLDREPKIVRVAVDSAHLIVDLDDGQKISIPFDWYPRLLHGTETERSHHEIGGGGYGIHWPDLDEDVSVENLLAARRSTEGPESLARWLSARSGGGPR